MESLEKQKQTLTRVRFIAELALIAPRHASDLKLALATCLVRYYRTKTTTGFFITLTDKQ